MRALEAPQEGPCLCTRPLIVAWSVFGVTSLGWHFGRLVTGLPAISSIYERFLFDNRMFVWLESTSCFLAISAEGVSSMTW